MKQDSFKSTIYKDYPNHDRFAYPEKLVRVTAGFGGEAILIFGSEKTALYDCGMAYAHEGLLSNIEKALWARGRKDVDYVLCSHTHYDHIGALPYIIKRWPEAWVCASAKAKQVFASEGAKATMRRLGLAARDTFTDSKEDILVDGFRVDRAVGDGDHISLGKEYLKVLEAKGHTDCSLVYVLEPDSIMFASESTGVLRNPECTHTAILKNYEDSIATAEKCKAYNPRMLICPHYGIIPDYATLSYFDLYIKSAKEEYDFITSLFNKGYTFDEILLEHEKKYWSEERGKAQPKAAYLENARITIKIMTAGR